MISFLAKVLCAILTLGQVMSWEPRGTYERIPQPNPEEDPRFRNVQYVRYHGTEEAEHLKRKGEWIEKRKHTSNRRELSTCLPNKDWVPLHKATIKPMRMCFSTDLLSLDKARLTGINCFAVGDQVRRSNLEGRSESTLYTCEKDDVITQDKIDQILFRLKWATTYFSELFSLRPTVEDIKITTPTLKDALEKTTYSNCDMVVIMSMIPHENSQVAGYARCLENDQHRRCVVGHFNWVPRTVQPEAWKANNPEAESEDRRLIVHEVLHLVNGVKPDSRYHIKDDGSCPDAEDLYYDETESWSKLKTRFVKTKKALAIARKQFNCPDLKGIPLEDQKIGLGSHWEARITGPEIMSYGDKTGESYLSDLTLAFLEDTGYYKANYSLAGRLNPPSAQENKTHKHSFLLKDMSKVVIPEDTDVLDATITPGYIRWGRHQGCNFIRKSPSEWSDKYTCVTESETGCTPDNRMTARCAIKTYGPSYPAARIIRGDPDRAKTINPSYPYIPRAFRYISAQQSTGGFNDAMDFAPVMAGYWNCLDKEPKNTVPYFKRNEGNISLSFSGIFDGIKLDLEQIKGQSHGSNARCFISSLKPLTSTHFSPKFPKYGLCYQANCYTSNYLQVGIVGTSGLYWYGCPQEGGKMYIPGFTGALHCPPAKEFCANEVTSGELFNETNVTLEWAIFGAICGVILIAAILLCVYWKKIDHKIYFCCGLGHPEDEERECHKTGEKIKGRLPMIKHHHHRSSGGWLLIVINFIWTCVGLAILGVAIAALTGESLYDSAARQIPLLLIGGGATVAIAMCGLLGGCKDHPSLKLVVYFYSTLTVILMVALAALFAAVMQDALFAMLEDKWQDYKLLFPDSYHDLNSTEAIARVYTLATESIGGVIAGLTLLAFSLVSGLICSGKIMTFHVVVRNFLMVFNCIKFAMACVCIGFSVKWLTGFEARMVVLAILPFCYYALVGLMGVISECQSKRQWYIAYCFFTIVNFILILGAGAGMIAFTEYVQEYLGGLTGGEISEIAQTWANGVLVDSEAGEEPMTEEEVFAWAKAHVQMVGIICLILSGVELMSIVFTGCVIKWSPKDGTKLKKGKLPHHHRRGTRFHHDHDHPEAKIEYHGYHKNGEYTGTGRKKQEWRRESRILPENDTGYYK